MTFTKSTFFLGVSPNLTTEQMAYVQAKLAEFIAKHLSLPEDNSPSLRICTGFLLPILCIIAGYGGKGIAGPCGFCF